MVVDRMEVYLDEAKEPLAVLKEPPYRLHLDTRKIPDGEHRLRVVTHFRGGGQEVREIPFTVNNYPDVLVLGVDEGGEVSGTVELRLSVGEPDLPVEPVRVNPLWYVVATVVVLGGIWSYFALSPAAEKIVAEVAPPAQEAAHGEGAVQPAAGVDPALMEKGKAIYEAHCAACHQATGQGMPPAFPALAGNANLQDAAMVLNVIKNGRGAMPAVGAAFSEEELKAVATYIRNSWGNSFGPVE
ncbi:cytochrome c, mono- and diheme variants family [Thermus oshimai JL-2]|uniref:Cytochrome c, mono-and diheme variants family n=1 Tax=Thermus oshimai JL-2 TaxID=751945 RepID=K7R2R1_THEOS|nr:c-type cytochrome [Thermus oshimai]AFV75189.1 cytochrome c, mono- and diheme variants family [Thermus oshimai JL-2]